MSINLLQAVNRFTRAPLSTQVRKMGVVAAVFMFILLQGTVYVRIVVLIYREILLHEIIILCDVD